LPILEKLKSSYLLWFSYYQTIPKTHRYSLGLRVDGLFVESIEAITTASFLGKGEKLPYIRVAIRKTDTLKVFLMILWETRSFDEKKYVALSIKVNEVGKMLGGWHGQIVKQNSPPSGGEK
jgi:hypothetical protein